MMANPFETPDFKALFKEWNKKLSDSGLKDVEVTFHGERTLKHSGGERRYEKLSSEVRDARLQFFTRVGQLVHETEFENDTDRQIMTLYSQGMTQKGILKELGIKGHKCRAYLKINKWLKAWGLK